MRRNWLATLLVMLLIACNETAGGSESSTVVTEAPTTTTAAPATTTTAANVATTLPASTTTTIDPHSRPDWLGSRVLPLRPDGFGEVLPTPPELVDRAFSTPDLLEPPADGDFEGVVQPVPADVVARSTWNQECPVGLEELAYVTVSHWGFDGEVHTGELIVNAAHADSLVQVFSRLFDVRFPIEEMRVIRADELELEPTGDGNVTTSFVCRPAVGSSSWSAHASGLAIDINPFHNPYLRGDLVLPELASYYTDRSIARPGMIIEGDPVVSAFAEIAWPWGGNWSTLDDWMHFSATGN
jgi:hypothetical protein